MNVDRIRPAVLALAAVALAAAALTGCQGAGAGDDGSAGVDEVTVEVPVEEPADLPTDVPEEVPAEPVDEAPVPPVTKAPAKVPTKSGAKSGSKKGSKTGGKTGGKTSIKKPSSPSSPDCVDTPPSPDEVDPDEVAVYRVEELDPSTGKVNLVLQHGVWGCPGEDGEAAPFVGTGEESRWALDQAAYVTATNPIVDGSASRRIGVQELIDWIDAHPDAGLVFRYATGDDGAIHRLEQVFTP
ncbi:hypothetical protein [Streptomyces sp. NPDC056144]|uniref:hypothetical protein n=1 Tax=unclassified Streptomyces TaxID=2593676 RepID=UPI0035D9EC10